MTPMTFVPSPDDSPSAPARDTWGRVVARDKKNRTNLHWYVVRTQPHQEAMLCDLLSQTIQAKTPNILEFYCPVRTTVRQVDESKKTRTPLFWPSIPREKCSTDAPRSSVRQANRGWCPRDR